MRSLKYSLICLLTICSSPIMHAAEQASSSKAVFRSTQTPETALFYLAQIQQQNHRRTIAYTDQELYHAESLISRCSDHIDTLVSTNNTGFSKNNLALAVMHGQTAMVKLLLKHGARVTAVAHHINGTNPEDAIRLCPEGNIEIFKDLLAADPNAAHTLNSLNGNGEAFLHDILQPTNAIDDAILESIKQKICCAIYYGVNPNLENDEGETAFDMVEDESFFPQESARQDLLAILNHQEEPGKSYYRKFIVKNFSGITGNIATHMRSLQITGPWKGTQKLALAQQHENNS